MGIVILTHHFKLIYVFYNNICHELLWALVMNDLKISILDQFRFDFFKIEISIFDPNFYFTAYDTLATHARGQSHGARWRVLFNIESMSDLYTFGTMTSCTTKHNNIKT